MRTATPTPMEKNNSKYNNCTLEWIELSTCTELSLKLEHEKSCQDYEDVISKTFLSICLAS